MYKMLCGRLIDLLDSLGSFFSALLQPGPAGIPQYDALLQAVDAGVLCTVLNNLARAAAS